MKKTTKKGFTLTELVVVIVIIGILAAVTIPALVMYFNSAKKSNDQQLIRNLNTALAERTLMDGKPVNMTEALAAAEDFGYDIGKINAKGKDAEIVWDSVNNVFCYYNAKENKLEYIPEANVPAGAQLAKERFYNAWAIKSIDAEGKVVDANGNKQTLNSYAFSVYARESAADTVETNKGFDAGTVASFSSIKYTNVSGDKFVAHTVDDSVVIRTNSTNTSLTINAPADIVNHFGYAGVVDVIAVANKSYHENGNVAFLEIAKGRVVLESESNVKQIHVSTKVTDVAEDGTKTKQANTFDQVIVALASGVQAPDFSRDEVALDSIGDEGTLVVEIEKEDNQSDYVYLHQQGLVEQIKVTTGASTNSANDVQAKAIDSTAKTGKDESLSNNTSSIANDIANNLKAGSTATPEQIASGTVDLSEIEDAGLSEETKADAMAEVIDELAGEEVAVDPNVESYVARIGTKGYMTFDEAYDKAENGNAIVLLKNIVLGEVIEGNFVQEEWHTSFDFDKAGITLDLNGKSLVCNATDDYLIAFYVKPGADLTIKDSVGGGIIRAPRAIRVIHCYGTINIYGGTIEAQYYDSYGGSEALRVDGTANIYGGCISSVSAFYYGGEYGHIFNFSLNNCGVTNIYGGTFTCNYKDEASNGIGNSGSLYIMENITAQGLYWTNDNSAVAQTIISVAEGKTLTVDGAYALKPANSKPIVLNGNAVYTDDEGQVVELYTQYE